MLSSVTASRSGTSSTFTSRGTRDDDLEARANLYNAALYYRFRVPVHTVIVLLRPAANDPALAAGLHYSVWPDRGRKDLTWEVVRMWRQPVEEFLAGGLGTLPLAPLCRMPGDAAVEEALPAIVRRIEERLKREATPEEGPRLMTAAFVLAGMRIPKEVAQQVF
jgi:hypothetical protein